MLYNSNILLTRSNNLAKRCAKKINFIGGNGLVCPLYSISYRKINMENIDFSTIDVIIFTSQHAVTAVKQFFSYQYNWHCIIWGCVGPATANVLQDFIDINPVLPVTTPYNSMSLLASMEQVVDFSSKRVLLIHGADTLPALSAKLQAQGAQVGSLIAYERDIDVSTSNLTYYAHCIHAVGVDKVVVTCATAIDSLIQASKRLQLTNATKLPLLVSSNRIAEYARDLKFFNITVATGSDDSAIINSLITEQSNKGFIRFYG